MRVWHMQANGSERRLHGLVMRRQYPYRAHREFQDINDRLGERLRHRAFVQFAKQMVGELVETNELRHLTVEACLDGDQLLLQQIVRSCAYRRVVGRLPCVHALSWLGLR